MLRAKFFWVLPILVGLAANRVAGQDVRAPVGHFGFVNADGSEIIALDSVPYPGLTRAAVCARAHVYRIAYARKQSRHPAGNGRQVAANFGNESGDVFRVIGDPAPTDETCYLSADSGFVAGVLPFGADTGAACKTIRLRQAAQVKHRPVLHCWTLGSATPNVEILALQFAAIDTSALASIVVADHGQLFFHDFPATYRGPAADVWRVDDNGTFSPADFGIPFCGRRGGRFVMALTWAGAEGENAYLLVADSANTLRAVAKSYRYWAPN
jgi:hypothetical protein